MTADRMMSEDRSDLTLAILTDIFKTQMSPVMSCLKASWAKETKMSHIIDPATTGLAKLLDPVAECFTPEVAKRVAELSADPDMQLRIDDLAEKCNQGTITPEETAEYDAYIRAMDVVAVLQKKARTLLAQSPTS